ncbi:MAG: isopentenyl-diphosphate Delta-isomerase [Sphingobacteriaceae bacterium]
MVEDQVILVNEKDEPIGTMGKLEVHQKGLLHRAFSVFIFNDKGEMLLQRRALSKYHSAGLWTNTCCSHPQPNEDTLAAANRRLREEMGMKADLTPKTSFIYKTPFDNGLTEHELDHVFIGYTNTDPVINKEEVDSFKWMSLEAIKTEIKTNPNEFTSWFKIALEKVF